MPKQFERGNPGFISTLRLRAVSRVPGTGESPEPSDRNVRNVCPTRRGLVIIGAMKVSGFTFLRNAQKLGYPFVESIRSILPIVDEYVIALGPCDDATEEMIRAIGDPKIRLLNTQWNNQIRNDYSIKGYVYGQQKTIALFNCTGDWAFYLEGDEVIHEDDLPAIRGAMERHLKNERVEALAFDYIHFYG